jgi:hypothetical protein
MARENNRFNDGINGHDFKDKLIAIPQAPILWLVLCVILNVMDVIQGQTDPKEQESLVNNMARTVIYIEHQREMTETTKISTLRGEEEIILYTKAQGSPEYTPLVKMVSDTGTGFLVLHRDILYIATARHVVVGKDPLRTFSSKGMYYIPSESNVVKGDFDELAKRIPDARWFIHKTSDIAIHPFEFPSESTRMWRVPESMLTAEPRELLTSVIVPGFPYPLGKDDLHLSPVLAIRDIVSWPIFIPDRSKVPTEKFVILNKRLAGGYSGSPVFTFRDPPTRSAFEGHDSKLAGIVSIIYVIRNPNPIKEGDSLQDELAAIVPTADLLELFGYPEVVAFETSYLEKIKAKKLSESQQKTNDGSPQDPKTGKGTQESPVK